MKSQFASAFPLLLLTAAVVATDPAVAAGAAPAAPAAAPVPAKAVREKQNGVARPSPGTATGNVWAIADKISTEQKRPALRAEVTKAGAEAGINASTVTTQFGQWRRFYGLKKEEKVAGEVTETAAQKKKREKAEAKAAAAAPAVVTTDAQVAAGNAAAEAAIEEANAAEAAGATVEG